MRRAATQAADERRLPEHLRPFFWDHQFGRLRWAEDRDLIISRVLASGNWQAIQWLRQQAGPDMLRRWFLEHEGRGLDRRRLRFWELILDLPHRQVNAWIRALDRDPWARRAGS